MLSPDPYSPANKLGRNIVVTGSVLAAHVAGLWALQAGLLKSAAIEMPKPEPVMVQLIAPEPTPTQRDLDFLDPEIAPGTGTTAKTHAQARAQTCTQATGDQGSDACAQCSDRHDGGPATGTAHRGAAARSALASPGSARTASAPTSTGDTAAVEQRRLPEQSRPAVPGHQPPHGRDGDHDRSRLH